MKEVLLPFVLLFFLIPIPLCCALLYFSSPLKKQFLEKSNSETLCQNPRHEDTQLHFCTWTRGSCRLWQSWACCAPWGHRELSGNQDLLLLTCAPRQRELVPELPWFPHPSPWELWQFGDSTGIQGAARGGQSNPGQAVL